MRGGANVSVLLYLVEISTSFFEEKDGLADLQTPQKKEFRGFWVYTACVGLGEGRANRREGISPYCTTE